jgi:hypothetical protein
MSDAKTMPVLRAKIAWWFSVPRQGLGTESNASGGSDSLSDPPDNGHMRFAPGESDPGARAALAHALVAPKGLERLGVGWKRENLVPATVAEVDQQHLVDVELAVIPSTARAVDGDRVLVACESPAKLAQIGAARQPARLAEEAEDLVAAAVHARDGRGAGHPPDRVLRDHLEERARVATAESIEDPADVVQRGYRSSGAIVSP